MTVTTTGNHSSIQAWRIKGEYDTLFLPMSPPRFRVTFHDLEHGLKRTIDVEAATAFGAVTRACEEVIARGFRIADFANEVRVEMIRSTVLAVSLSAIVAGGGGRPHSAASPGG